MRILTYLVALACLFVSCKDEIDPYAGAPSSVEYLDIGDAQYLAIDDRDYGLYKLSKDEKQDLFAQRVAFLDANREPIDSIFSHVQLAEVTQISEYLIGLRGSFSILIDSMDVYFETLLVNTETGKIYDFNGHFPYQGSKYMGSKYLQTDQNGDIYYYHNQFFNYVPSGIYRIGNIEGEIFQESYVSQSQVGEDNPLFYVSPESHCFYYSAGGLKIKTPANGVIPVYDDLRNIFSFEGKTFAFINGPLDDPALANQIDLVEVIVDGDTYDLNTIRKLDYISNNEYAYFYENENHGYLINTYIDGINAIGVVFDRSFNELMNIVLPENIAMDLVKVEYFGDGHVWFGNESTLHKSIYKFDLSSFSVEQRSYNEPENATRDVAVLNSYESVEFPTNIEVYEYEFMSSGEISFTGFDLTTEEDVSGIIDLNGNLTILERSNEYSFTFLERVN